MIVALGSNLGPTLLLVRSAIRRLQEHWPHGFRASSLWDTTPVACPPGSPRFVNAVVLFDPHPGDRPERVLDTLQAWEREAGRVPKTVPNEPRPLDLDLIAFQGEPLVTHRLTLPHPRAHLRRFVLAPLDEIAPDLLLPGWTAPVRDLLQRLPATECVQRLDTEIGATGPVTPA